MTTPPVTAYAYDMLGNKIYELDPNGDVTNWSYNEMNELSSEVETNSAGKSLYSVSYILNSDGTRHSAAETELQPNGTNATLSTTWTYDALDRLTGETITSSLSGGSQSETWSYDMDGNRVKQVKVAGGVTDTTTYTYNGDNELTQQVDSVAGTTTFGYDANGSQTTTTVGGTVTQTDTYDVRNRLQKVVDSSGTTTYVYDDAGDRVQETTGGTTTYYLIDDNNPTGYAKPIEVRVGSATGTPTTTYILGMDVIGQANSSGAVSYLVIDGRDDTRALVSSSGAVTATFNYDAFGNPIGFTAVTAPTVFLFQQMMFDAPSGTEFTISRQTPLGAPYWIETDPPGYSNNDDPLTLNGYLFDGANPISNIDLSGHDFDLISLSITFGIGALINSSIAFIGGVRSVKTLLIDALVGGIGAVILGPSLNVISNAVSSVLLRTGLAAVTAGTVGLLQNVLNQVLNNPSKPINWRQAEAAAIITAVTAGIFTGYAGDTYDGGTLEDEDAKKLFDLTTAVASEFVGVTGLGLYNTLVKWHQQGII